ncbi:hypothetical protein GGR54DRAFT_600837 [Hypoxylon sp. NC1633]|nr:hypothetical protein GGR54DRAFT_600837 [Hypoxylon sp. NC1633]
MKTSANWSPDPEPVAVIPSEDVMLVYAHLCLIQDMYKASAPFGFLLFISLLSSGSITYIVQTPILRLSTGFGLFVFLVIHQLQQCCSSYASVTSSLDYIYRPPPRRSRLFRFFLVGVFPLKCLFTWWRPSILSIHGVTVFTAMQPPVLDRKLYIKGT